MKKDSVAAIFVGVLLSFVAVVLAFMAGGYSPVWFMPGGVLVVLLWFGIWWSARKRPQPQ